MPKVILLQANERDILLREALLIKRYIKHEYAVPLQTLPNRIKGVSSNTIILVLGINLNNMSNYVKKHNEGEVEAWFCWTKTFDEIKSSIEKVKASL